MDLVNTECVPAGATCQSYGYRLPAAFSTENPISHQVIRFHSGGATCHICDPSVHNESHVGKVQYGVYGTIG